MNLLVHSCLAVHARAGRAELPGSWFVAALEPLGIAKAAVRQALFRMVNDGELFSRKEGRVRLYRPSAYSEASVAAGTEKIFGPRQASWDGEWTIVQYRFDGARRVDRDRVRDILEVEGFACLSRGLYIHPRDRTGRVLQAVARSGTARDVMVFRARRLGGEPDGPLVARLWDLRGLARRYRKLLATFEPRGRRTSERVAGAEAFAARLALAISFLEIAWDDPDLPAALLPNDWPGERARALVRSLYEKLLPAALAHGESILSRIAEPRGAQRKDLAS